MLPTNEKAPTHDYLFLYKPSNRLVKNGFVQHLYILSDEEIKEGDWFVGFADGSIKPFVKQADESTVEINNWQLNKKGHSSNKKIIATTDKSIILPERFPSFTYLPQPSQSFIEKFVEEYNKGNVITEVMVEWEYNSYSTKTNGELTADLKLKINPDNTINISMPKDSWSREEVVELLYKHTEYMLSGKKDTLDKWIEENL